MLSLLIDPLLDRESGLLHWKTGFNDSIDLRTVFVQERKRILPVLFDHFEQRVHIKHQRFGGSSILSTITPPLIISISFSVSILVVAMVVGGPPSPVSLVFVGMTGVGLSTVIVPRPGPMPARLLMVVSVPVGSFLSWTTTLRWPYCTCWWRTRMSSISLMAVLLPAWGTSPFGDWYFWGATGEEFEGWGLFLSAHFWYLEWGLGWGYNSSPKNKEILLLPSSLLI